jgi:GAF domain-containing protein
VPKAKDLEARLQRTEQQLRLFQKISRFMVRDLSLQEVLQGVVDLIVEFMECDSCLIYLLDANELGPVDSTSLTGQGWLDQQATLRERLAPVRLQRGAKVAPYSLEKQWN